MTNIQEANRQEALDTLKEVLEKCRECDCLVTLRQAVQRADGNYNYMDLQQTTCSAACTVYVNENFIYVTISTGETAKLQCMTEMWEILLKHGTECMLAGKTNDYLLAVDLIKQELENSLAYTLAFVQPVFARFDNQSLLFAFTLDSLYFSKDTVNLADLEYEEELYKDYETIQTNVNFEETSEFINTDQYTGI